MAVVARRLIQLENRGVEYNQNYIQHILAMSGGRLNQTHGREIYIETIMQYCEYFDRPANEYVARLQEGFKIVNNENCILSILNQNEAQALRDGFVELGLFIYTKLFNDGLIRQDHFVMVPVFNEFHLVVELHVADDKKDEYGYR